MMRGLKKFVQVQTLNSTSKQLLVLHECQMRATWVVVPPHPQCQLPVEAHRGSVQVEALVAGLLPPTGETWKEFPARSSW